MKRSLLLQDVCDILVNRSIMTADQRSQVLARQKELRAKVATLQDLQNDRAGHSVTPGRNNRHAQPAQRTQTPS